MFPQNVAHEWWRSTEERLAPHFNHLLTRHAEILKGNSLKQTFGKFVKM